MIPFFNLVFKSGFKYKLLIGITVLLSACLSSSKEHSVATEFKAEKMSSQLSVSLPEAYTGVGYYESEDAPGFKKQKKGEKVRLSFEDKESLGLAAHKINKNELPNTLKGLPERKNIGLNIVYFYNNNNGMTDLNSHGVVYFLFDQEYKEVLYVNYQAQFQTEVENILKTIKVSL